MIGMLLTILQVNVQDHVIRDAEIELQTREEELRFMKLEKQELMREIALARAQLKKRAELENKLVDVQVYHIIYHIHSSINGYFRLS